MINIIYFSAATYLYKSEELVDMLESWRKNNAEVDVTGVMIYYEGSIIQILEGEAENVHKLYNKISKDDRHKSVFKVIDVPIEKRNFTGWSMGFQQASAQDWENLTGYLNLNNIEDFKEIQASENKHIIKIINSFCRVNRITKLNF